MYQYFIAVPFVSGGEMNGCGYFSHVIEYLLSAVVVFEYYRLTLLIYQTGQETKSR